MTTSQEPGPGASTIGGAAPATSPRRRRRHPLQLLRRWVSPLAILVLWQVLSSTGALDERTLASPAAIFARAVELVDDGTLGSETLVSVQRVLIGFAIGAVIAVVLAVTAGLSRIGDDAIDPPMQMLRTLPTSGWCPSSWAGPDARTEGRAHDVRRRP